MFAAGYGKRLTRKCFRIAVPKMSAWICRAGNIDTKSILFVNNVFLFWPYLYPISGNIQTEIIA